MLRVPLPYHPAMYVPALLMHGSLVLRVVVGDGFDVGWAWQIGGTLNIVSVLLFVAVALWSALSAGTGKSVAQAPELTAIGPEEGRA